MNEKKTNDKNERKSIADTEKDILKFWKQGKVFQKSLDKTKKGNS